LIDPKKMGHFNLALLAREAKESISKVPLSRDLVVSENTAFTQRDGYG